MPIKSKTRGSQKGTFVGNPAAVHIHIVSDNTHIQVGNKRHNVDPDNDVSAAAALAWLTTSGGAGRPGYAACLAWPGQPNRQRV